MALWHQYSAWAAGCGAVNAQIVKLVDTAALKPVSQEWEFKSLYEHQNLLRSEVMLMGRQIFSQIVKK